MMWECAYGREPLDGKLFLLRLTKRIWVLLVAALLGALLCGTIYFVQKIVLGEGITYETTSTYYVDYGTDPLTDNTFTYINGTTWNDMWIQSDVFISDILKKTGMEAEKILGKPLTEQMLKSYISADLPSDLRMPVTKVKTPDAKLTMLIKTALEEEMLTFGANGAWKEIDEIRLVISPAQAERTIVDNRIVRACVLGAILAVFFTFVFMAFCFVTDDSIYVPATFEYRYHIPMLGTLHSPELWQNFKALYQGKEKVSVICVDEEIAATDVSAALTDKLTEKACQVQLIGMPGVLTCPEVIPRIKETDGLILCISAGKKDGRRIAHMLNLLQKQDIAVTAALLIHEDEWLQKAYYLPGILKKKA